MNKDVYLELSITPQELINAMLYSKEDSRHPCLKQVSRLSKPLIHIKETNVGLRKSEGIFQRGLL